MKNSLRLWERLEVNGHSVYVYPENPDWFVPDDQADFFLKEITAGTDFDKAICATRDSGNNSIHKELLDRERLVSQISTEPSQPYFGRASMLELKELKECWFHITNNCNLACKHCLFGASPAETLAIAPDQLKQALVEARKLGCTLFYFTGGEPFVYPGFMDILDGLLSDPDVHAVVLTNGMLLEKQRDALRQLPKERLHLQISMDGLEKGHESLRGKGSFAKLLENLKMLQETHISPTLSVAVSSANISELPDMVSFAAEHGFNNIHFLWHFVRGKGTQAQFVAPAEILPQLIRVQEIAEENGIIIDNVETIKSQVFSTPGTRYDLSNTGWESIAVGPDGCVYPSPALVGIEELNCGALADGLENVWRQSKVLENIRQASVQDSSVLKNNPLKYLVGGGDIDHSYLTGGEFVGHDPYMELYENLALWLIVRKANQYQNRSTGGILLRMGDVRHDCPDGGQGVTLTHCNCVISISSDQGHASVREFYGQAAVRANEDIVNPFAPEQADAGYIPSESRKRSYGCGSPINDAEVKSGEALVDLGSGSGVECFMASEKVGPSGRVYGIDMTDEMLNLARSSQVEVVKELGYSNVDFRKGFLEDIPLSDSRADVVISNCVINLSPDKRKTFHEIYRILKPGGRMVVSDIVTDESIPVAIKNNEKFRGECLGGAMQQEDLIAMLRGIGFGGVRLIKRFPYRQEGDTTFYSLTFRCYKPEEVKTVEVVYRGPFGAVYTENGVLLLKGKKTAVSLTEAKSLDDSVFVLDDEGTVANMQMVNSCCPSASAPEVVPMSTISPFVSSTGSCCGSEAPLEKKKSEKIVPLAPLKSLQEEDRHQTGCMVCGNEIVYQGKEMDVSCYYCGGVKKTNALCKNDHFICDDCHQQDGLNVIKLICTETKETDMLVLLQKLREHPAVPMHGPEHHAMVPGIILATYRNRGGVLRRESILSGIERGSKVPGGVCGFWGNCGAAVGVGIAFSVLLEATPLTPSARQQVQQITSQVLGTIAETKGARCCQRETVTALEEAARLSQQILPVSLLAEHDFCCTQYEANTECIRTQCLLWCDMKSRESSS